MSRVGILCLLLLIGCGAHDEGDVSDAKQDTTTDARSVTLSNDVATQNGIEVATLQALSSDVSTVVGNARVVDVSDLVTAASQYASAIAQRDQATARAAASHAELQRLRTLNADDRNVSDRAVQDALATSASDDAATRSAEVAASSVDAAIRQRWGPTLTKAVLSNQPWARRVISRESVIVEVAFTDEIEAPPRVVLTGAGGHAIVANYIAPAPAIDSQTQRPAYDYLASSAQLPIGFVTTMRAQRSLPGVLVPSAAVVWSDDHALVFLEDRAGHYVQHALDVTRPIAGGYLDRSLRPGDRIVVTGAQQLLSEQHKPTGEAE